MPCHRGPVVLVACCPAVTQHSCDLIGGGYSPDSALAANQTGDGAPLRDPCGSPTPFSNIITRKVEIMNRRQFALGTVFSGLAGAVWSVGQAADKPKAKAAEETCIKNCTDCAASCKECSLCCKEDKPECSRMCLTCHHMCMTCAKLCEAGSPLHEEACKLCEQVCIACAKSCRECGKDCCKKCAEVCDKCAAACKACRA